VLGTLLGLSAGVIAIVTIAIWYRLMVAVRVPDDRTAFVAAMALSMALGVLALALPLGLVARLSAWLGVIASGVFIGLRMQSGQASVAPAAGVGDEIIDFTAADDEGNDFTLSSLRGQPFLLKFFRGHW
jgi:cytochrome oxidase Cu insertion factor (SCO1/SenC/PrrC family)